MMTSPTSRLANQRSNWPRVRRCVLITRHEASGHRELKNGRQLGSTAVVYSCRVPCLVCSQPTDSELGTDAEWVGESIPSVKCFH